MLERGHGTTAGQTEVPCIRLIVFAGHHKTAGTMASAPPIHRRRCSRQTHRRHSGERVHGHCRRGSDYHGNGIVSRRQPTSPASSDIASLDIPNTGKSRSIGRHLVELPSGLLGNTESVQRVLRRQTVAPIGDRPPWVRMNRMVDFILVTDNDMAQRHAATPGDLSKGRLADAPRRYPSPPSPTGSPSWSGCSPPTGWLPNRTRSLPADPARTGPSRP